MIEVESGEVQSIKELYNNLEGLLIDSMLERQTDVVSEGTHILESPLLLGDEVIDIEEVFPSNGSDRYINFILLLPLVLVQNLEGLRVEEKEENKPCILEIDEKEKICKIKIPIHVEGDVLEGIYNKLCSEN